ncbi:MAG TPA: hypothetical protein DDW26_01865, partial [Rhizobiales bacterium]|nr:hypothetical protein [Hyphomicrobiales bacterium]
MSQKLRGLRCLVEAAPRILRLALLHMESLGQTEEGMPSKLPVVFLAQSPMLVTMVVMIVVM